MKPDGTFQEGHWQEKCQVKFPGCQDTPDVRITCIVEGASLMSCHSCFQVWQKESAANPGFENRCPRCAGWNPERMPVRAFTKASPLHGDVAEAIDRAMHAEGLLLDVRHKVLQRLAQDAQWLSQVTRAGHPALAMVGHPGERVVPG